MNEPTSRINAGGGLLLQSRVRLYRLLNACWPNMSTSVTTRLDPTVMICGEDLENLRPATLTEACLRTGRPMTTACHQRLEVIEGCVPLDVWIKGKTKQKEMRSFISLPAPAENVWRRIRMKPFLVNSLSP